VSGLVVRPGDVLVVPIAPPSHLVTRERERMAALIEADMPGVKVLVCEGIAGGPFVYRPNRPFIDPHGSHPHDGAYCVDCPQCIKVPEREESGSALSIVDNPVTGKPLGYVKDPS
jgi:hypothetical protein